MGEDADRRSRGPSSTTGLLHCGVVGRGTLSSRMSYETDTSILSISVVSFAVFAVPPTTHKPPSLATLTFKLEGLPPIKRVPRHYRWHHACFSTPEQNLQRPREDQLSAAPPLSPGPHSGTYQTWPYLNILRSGWGMTISVLSTEARRQRNRRTAACGVYLTVRSSVG